MGYKMNGNPAKLGTIKGTSGHASAVKLAQEQVAPTKWGLGDLFGTSDKAKTNKKINKFEEDTVVIDGKTYDRPTFDPDEENNQLVNTDETNQTKVLDVDTDASKSKTSKGNKIQNFLWDFMDAKAGRTPSSRRDEEGNRTNNTEWRKNLEQKMNEKFKNLSNKKSKGVTPKTKKYSKEMLKEDARLKREGLDTQRIKDKEESEAKYGYFDKDGKYIPPTITE